MPRSSSQAAVHPEFDIPDAAVIGLHATGLSGTEVQLPYSNCPAKHHRPTVCQPPAFHSLTHGQTPALRTNAMSHVVSLTVLAPPAVQGMEVSDDASTTLRSGSPPGYPPSTSCRASIHHRCSNRSHHRCRRSCGRSSRYPTTHPPPHCHRQHWTTCHLPRCPRHRWRGWRSQMTHPPHSTQGSHRSVGVRRVVRVQSLSPHSLKLAVVTIVAPV